ncbi:transmembrane protease serine 11D-like isoform X2 [Penaeus chinensis]|uniref:transmembrane protease serine 11D-like isoform X2 n=1 Tax=Penaeus chinensis TaxID=139456 RepID=UPI001FB64079|nr:transmembrane protease serine 11D-like isoform X2 [Penaeus chinensis]
MVKWPLPFPPVLIRTSVGESPEKMSLIVVVCASPSNTSILLCPPPSNVEEFGELTELAKLFRRCRGKATQDPSARSALVRCLRKGGVAEGSSARGGAKRGRKSKKKKRKKRKNAKKKVTCGETYCMKAGDKKIFRVRANMDVCAIFVHGDGGTELEMNCKTFDLSACTKEYFFVQDQTSEKKFCGNKGPEKMTGIQAVYLLYERAGRSRRRPRVWCSIEGVEPGGAGSGVEDEDETSSAVQAMGCDNVCGQAPAGAGATRIVGGEEAGAGEYPWMARVDISRGSGSISCGGAIVTTTHVVTASHCVNDENSEVTVRAGMHDLASYQENTTQVIKAKQILLHPEYSPVTSANDIALLSLEEPLKWASGVGPVCLPPGADFEDRVAVVTGWGAMGSHGPYATKLNEVAVTITDQEMCEKAYISSTFHVTDNHICAADPGKDACHGDSGGPLVIKENGRWVLIGIVSFGRGCAMPGFPGVYTRVSSYNTWLLKNMTFGSC